MGKIKMDKVIALRGNPHILDEITKRTEKERKTDVYQEGMIVYPDLVFTLKNKPDAYFRPVVEKTKYGFRVISNNIFVHAAKEAGLEQIDFDLVKPKGIDAGKLLEEYKIKIVSEDLLKNYIKRLLFFKEQPITYLGSHENIKMKVYPENNCISYCLQFKDSSVSERNMTEDKLVKELVRSNGPLRSIDGLIRKEGKFRCYFE
jgi:hypothetical protein